MILSLNASYQTFQPRILVLLLLFSTEPYHHKKHVVKVNGIQRVITSFPLWDWSYDLTCILMCLFTKSFRSLTDDRCWIWKHFGTVHNFCDIPNDDSKDLELRFFSVRDFFTYIHHRKQATDCSFDTTTLIPFGLGTWDSCIPKKRVGYQHFIAQSVFYLSTLLRHLQSLTYGLRPK